MWLSRNWHLIFNNLLQKVPVNAHRQRLYTAIALKSQQQVVSNSVDNRILGGSAATPNEWCMCACVCGPMMYQQSPGTYIQLGVASFWWDCYTGYPSGFVRVNKYVDWIKSNKNKWNDDSYRCSKLDCVDVISHCLAQSFLIIYDTA